ncbi:histidine--tRNA ligase [Candidatus Micrarchaeota archaeon]|nr:histidine--tRNA ligase [Candidatus Micrarchaeota archaeon]
MEEKMLSAPRGTRDFLPDEKRVRDLVVTSIRKQFERFGFEPLETPAIERFDVLANKFAGGEEILKEVFQFQDQGARALGLRYDFTVPMCRVVADNPRMPMPFKRYQMGPVWRDGPLKAGRYREFTQCDADISGSKYMIADAEIIALTKQILNTWFNQKFAIRLSNRKILSSLLESSGIPKEKTNTVMLSLDKLEKIGLSNVIKELKENGIPVNTSEKIVALTSLKGTNETILSELGKNAKTEQGKEGVRELKEVMELAKQLGAGDVIQIDPSLARGLNYYTSTIFEAFLNEGPVTSSVAAGGRYDDIIQKFTGKQSVPAVGISFGLDVICEIIKQTPSLPVSEKTKVFIIPISKEPDSKALAFSLEIARTLRTLEVNTAIDLMQRSPSKNLDYASRKGFKYALLIGEKEAAQQKVTVKELATGKEELLPVKDALRHLN